jgi:hypothetical protein
VHQFVHQVFGDNIMLAWVSKYCDGGTPLYTLDPTEAATYLEDLEDTYLKDAVYLYDLFGVGGSQGSVDYTLQGHPEVGEIPFSCVWTARGKLLAGDDPSTTEAEATYVMWSKPERLTSGARDANLPAVDCAAAGCMLTWQEDPDGLRPGQGLGPGEGWSGAVAWAQTDIWYSHISAAEFDLVFDAAGTVAAPLTMAEYGLLTDATMPKPYVPMAMPVRLTDNAMCKAANDTDPYCYIDFDTIDDIDHTNVDTLQALTAPETGADFCNTQESWENSGGVSMDICVTEDNRLLNGKVAATRVRMNLKPYTRTDGTPGAWIVMAAEESKGLGDVLTEDLEAVDIGKDIWYYSFDPFKTGADEFMVAQGGMLNQPAQCNFDSGLDDPLCSGLAEGDFYPIQSDERESDVYPFYLTEIARRFALTTNSVSAAVNSESGLSAMLIYKQGIINQGGPADIMLRRVLIDDTVFDPAVDNPYAFENMECADWEYEDGSNPNYLQGVCLSPAINITGSTIVTCDPDQSSSAVCADLWPLNDDGSNNVPDGTFPKVYEWRQCDGGSSIDGCEDDSDLDDQTWENPFDVAKGHRGYLDGDYVMMMYAWAPNWNSNTVGNDHYNLYVRRSFDGGLTWTTTPAALDGDGTTYFEYYYDGSIGVPLEQEWVYGAGDFEQGRNVSLLTGNKITILDPRYSPPGGMKLYPTIRTDWLTANGIAFTDLPYEDDIRVQDKYFIVYETGDNTTVAEGEATPLNLYYSRGTNYGDDYEVMDYPTETDDVLLDRWPWLENKDEILSGEAGMLANPGCTFMYAVWNQWEEEILPDGHELVHNSDMPFRRLLYLPDDSTVTIAPEATILYVSDYVVETSTWPADEYVTMVGSGKDRDNVGDREDVSYHWWCETIVDGGFVFNERSWQAPPNGWIPGKHDFSFQVTDSEGQKSEIRTVTLWVAEKFYNIYLPTITR